MSFLNEFKNYSYKIRKIKLKTQVDIHLKIKK